ncbi:MAG: hypothetical protein LC722_02530 [Actinobacteria bacterium]|nr:hypothetical protein [Actinomycetota bacterium]
MAIKGKKKTTSGRRPGTNAPRPTVVVPKRPILARRSTKWGILALVLAVVAGTLLVAWNKEQDKKERERRGQAIDQVNGQLELAVAGVGAPGAGSAFAILGEFTAQVESLRTGQGKPEDVETAAKPLPKNLTDAVETLSGIEVPEQLRNTEYTDEVIDARTTMIEALNVYRVGVQLVREAVDLTGADRTALLDRASEQFAIGARLFDFGHQKIVNIRVALGTFSGQEFNPLPPSP